MEINEQNQPRETRKLEGKGLCERLLTDAYGLTKDKVAQVLTTARISSSDDRLLELGYFSLKISDQIEANIQPNKIELCTIDPDTDRFVMLGYEKDGNSFKAADVRIIQNFGSKREKITSFSEVDERYFTKLALEQRNIL